MAALAESPVAADQPADAPAEPPMTERASKLVADLDAERALALLAARLRVEVNQAALARTLPILGRTLAGKTALAAVLNAAVLNNVLIEAEMGESGGALPDGTLRLTTTNLENATVATLQATVLTPGAFTVPHDLLLGLVSRLGAGPVTLTGDGTALTVQQGRAKSRLKGIAADEMPSLPKTAGGASVTLSVAAWRQIIDLVALVAGKDEARSWLAGVHLVGRPGEAVVAEAADGVRLARLAAVSGTEMPPGDELLDVLVPKSVLGLLRRLLPSKGGDDTLLTLDVGKERNAVRLTAPLPDDNAYRSLYFIGRLYEAVYPDLARVIPRTAVATLRLDRLALHAAVDRIALFARDAGHAARCEVVKGALRLRAGWQSVGEHEEELDAHVDFAEAVPSDNPDAPPTPVPTSITIALNTGQLLDAVGAVPGDTIEMRVVNDHAPVVFTGEELPGYLHLTMPVTPGQ